MACFNHMPDLVISLDTVFYPDFDVSIGTNIIYVVFYLPAIKMTIVKKLREGVAYNKARNELCIWLTDDDLSKIRKSAIMVQLQVRIVDIFTDEMFCSTAQIVNMEPVIIHRDRLIAEEKGFENLMKLIDWDTHNPYLECLRHDTHHQSFYNGNHTNREKEKPMKTKKDIDRIVITKDGENGVLLRAYSDDEIVEKTIAKCSPDDIFDFNIGAKLAVNRLYDGYDMTPKPKRKPYNGMIFVAKYPGTILKPNTLYRVRNGVLILGREPYIFENMSDDDLTEAVYHTLYSSGGTMDQIKRSTAVHFVKE